MISILVAYGSYIKVTKNITVVVPVTGITIDTPMAKNTTSAAITIKDTLQLTPVLTPANPLPTDSTVKWKSDNPSIVSVGSSGLITGKKSGSANITVITKDKKQIATIQITVK